MTLHARSAGSDAAEAIAFASSDACDDGEGEGGGRGVRGGGDERWMGRARDERHYCESHSSVDDAKDAQREATRTHVMSMPKAATAQAGTWNWGHLHT